MALNPSQVKGLLLKKFQNTASNYSTLKKELIIQFLILLVAEILFLSIVQIRSKFELTSIYTWLYFLDKIVFDWLVFFTLLMVSIKYIKNKYISWIFASFYILTIFTDSLIYLFGSTVFRGNHIHLITLYSLKSFFNIYSFLVSFTLLIIIVLLYYAISRISIEFQSRKILKYLIIVPLIGFINLPSSTIAMNIKLSGDEMKRYLLSCKKTQLEYISQNSFINFFEQLLKNRKANVALSNNLSEFENVIKKYDLPIGERHYDNLKLNQFNKIILFTSESLSLDLLSGYNPKLKAVTSEFYSSEEIKDKMFLNYRTSAHNTLSSQLVTFNSHPNRSLFNHRSPENFKNSFVNLLKNSGYETIFLRSASKFFDNQNDFFKNLGFDKIIAREEFQKTDPQYVYGWGVADRIMYNKVVDILKENKNQKLFLTVLGTDTHPLEGRGYYSDLKYPELKGDYKSYVRSGRYLKSIYYNDYDIGQTIKKIKEQGLFTDDTLIIITADHACPLNNVVEEIEGYPNTSLARIPLVFLTPQKLPEVDKKIKLSQLDLAPTILHLLNLKVPKGYWGNSIFSDEKKEQYIGYDMGTLFIENEENQYAVGIQNNNTEEKELIKLFKTLIVD